ncbi:MAG: permease [Marinoscillum sp.]
MSQQFLQQWGEAAYTTTGFFWMAMWAFILGYIVSSMVQVFVTRERMRKYIGESNLKSLSIASFFGFISSSCSFAALATTKSLFQKGASFAAAIAYLLASTNLVIELGVVISIFLGWQFVVGEYVGGILLILSCWLLIKLIKPKKLIEAARKSLGKPDNHHMKDQSFWEKFRSNESWQRIGQKYAMEWQMVWKDVTVGFTIAGIVAVFVPDSFFQTLFINSGSGSDYSFFTLLEHVIVGPVAAFLTFIGSMGNIPLAALLFDKGVSFAGVMAFIFSDLVVFPVLRINAKYYGWKMSLFILFLLFSSLITTSLILHYGFSLAELLPDTSVKSSITEGDHFKTNYTFFLNLIFVAISGVLAYVGFVKGKGMMHHGEMAQKSPALEKTLKYLALICYVWLGIGLILKFLI